MQITRTARSARYLMAGFVALIGTSIPARAQGDSGVSRNSWASGFSISVPGSRQEVAPLFSLVGATFTELRPNRPSMDFWVGTIPIGLAFGAVVLAARSNIALPLAVSRDVLLLPSGGFTFAALVTAGGDASAGINGGVAAILGPPDAPGLRLGITWHRLSDSREAIWLCEIGVVSARRRKK